MIGTAVRRLHPKILRARALSVKSIPKEND